MKIKRAKLKAGAVLGALFSVSACGANDALPASSSHSEPVPAPSVVTSNPGLPVQANSSGGFTADSAPSDMKAYFKLTEDIPYLEDGLDKLDFASRTVRLTGSIDQDVANRMSRELQALNELDPDAPITMIINSPGGYVSGGMWAIYDTIQAIDAPVDAVCYGRCVSAAGFLFASATGKRSIAENAYVMLHESSGGVSGSARTSEIKANMRKRLEQHERQYDIFEAKTGIPAASWEVALKDDFYVSADQAIEMGLADEIIQSKHKVSPPKRKAGFPSDYCEKDSPYNFHPDYCRP